MDEVDTFFKEINDVLFEGHKNGYLSDYELKCMLPEKPSVGKLYGLAQIHKQFTGSPPLRPIASGIGTMTENMAHYLDHHSKDLKSAIPTHLDDHQTFCGIWKV